MNSHAQDSEPVQPVSFGEILKIKEKQLQEEQEINGSSVAVALAALQIPSLRLPMLALSLSDRSEKVDTQADLQLETPEARSSDAGIDQTPMRSAPAIIAAPAPSVQFSGSDSRTDTHPSESIKQSISLKEAPTVVPSATIPAEVLHDTTQAVTKTETFTMPSAAGLIRTANTMRMATLPTGNEEAPQEVKGQGLVAEILSQHVTKQTDNMTGTAKVLEAPGNPAKAVVENQSTDVAQENHIPSIQPDIKHEDVNVGTRTTEMPDGVSVADTEAVRDQQTLAKNWDTLVSEVSTLDTHVYDQASEVFTGPVANAESSAGASIPISVESLPIQPAVYRKDMTASGQTMEKQAAVFEPSPENLPRANQTGDGFTDSEVSDYVSINNAQPELAQSHTNENRLSSASLPRIQFNENHEGVEAQTGTDSIDREVLRSSVQQNSIHETKAAEQKASVAIPNSAKLQTVPYVVESTDDRISTANTQVSSETSALPPPANANSETATIAAEKTRTQNNTYTQILENSQPHVKESAAQTDILDAYNQPAAAELEYPTIVSEYEIDIAGARSVVDPTLVQKSIEQEASKVETRAMAEGSTSMPKAENAPSTIVDTIGAIEESSSSQIPASFIEYARADTAQAGNSTPSSIDGNDNTLAQAAHALVADQAGLDREPLILETKSTFTLSASNREVIQAAQDQESSQGLSIQYEANQEKIIVKATKIEQENEVTIPAVEKSSADPVFIDDSDAEITRPMSDTNFGSLEPAHFKTGQQIVEPQTSIARETSVEFSPSPALDPVVDLNSAGQNILSDNGDPSTVVTATENLPPEFHPAESHANWTAHTDAQVHAETKEDITVTVANSEMPTVSSFEAAANNSISLNHLNTENIGVEATQADGKVPVLPKTPTETNNEQRVGEVKPQHFVSAEKPTNPLNQSMIESDFVQKENEAEKVSVEMEAMGSRVSVPTTRAPQSGKSTTAPVQGREPLTVETKGVFTPSALKREVPDIAQGLPIQHEANPEKKTAEATKIEQGINVAVPVARNPQPAVEMENQAPDPIVLPNPVISGESDGEITQPMPDNDFAAPQPVRFKTDKHMVEQQTSVAADAPVELSQATAQDLRINLNSASPKSTHDSERVNKVVVDLVNANSPDSTPIAAVRFVTTEQDNTLETETAKQSATPENSVTESTQAVFHGGESPANSFEDVDVQMQGESKEGITATAADSETLTVTSFETTVKASSGQNNIQMKDVTVETSRTISESDQSASIVETMEPDIKVSVISTDSPELDNDQGIGGTETQTSERAEKTNISLNQAGTDPAFVQTEIEPEEVNIEPEAKVSRVSVSTMQAPQSIAAPIATPKTATAAEEIEVESQPDIQTNEARVTVVQPESDIQPEQVVQSKNSIAVEPQAVKFQSVQQKAVADAPQFDSTIHTSPMISSDQSSEHATESMKMQSAPAQTEVPATNNADLPEVISSQTGTNMGTPQSDGQNYAEQVATMSTVVSEVASESTTKIPSSTSADSSLGIHRQSVSSIRPEVEVQDFPTVTANADKTLPETSVPSSSAVNAQTSVSLGSKSSIKVDHGKEALDTDKPQSTDEKTAPIDDHHRSTETVEQAAMGTNFAKEAVVGHSKDRPAIQIDPHAAEVVEQVIHHLNGSLKGGPSSMHLHLNPEEWGAIEVEMTRDSRGVSVTFFAEQASTGKLLETQLSQLRQSLADSGVQLSGLNIGQHSHSGQEGGFPNQNTDFAQHPSRQPAAFQSKVTTEEDQRPERYTGQMSEVDYLI